MVLASCHVKGLASLNIKSQIRLDTDTADIWVEVVIFQLQEQCSINTP